MSDYISSDPKAALDNASRAGRPTGAASWWYPLYILLVGFWAFADVVAIEVFYPSGIARWAALAVLALALGLLMWWAESHGVFPEKALRRFCIAAALWLGLYMFVAGPFVRWRADTSLAWWSVAAAVMASPFLVLAWREWRRS